MTTSDVQALVDGPCTGVSRQAIGFSKLSLTDFKISISRSAREKQVRKQFDADGVSTRWAETAWARKIARKTCRARLTDFDRYKLKVLRQQVRSTCVGGVCFMRWCFCRDQELCEGSSIN